MTVAAPADRRFRRAHVKPMRKHRRRLGWRVAQVVLLVIGLGYAGSRATRVVEPSALLKVKRIDVHGNSRLSSGEVLALLEGLKDRNILAVNLSEWRSRLLRSSWVEEAIVRRILPSTVDVTITERRALGISRMGDNLYLIDSRGVVIDEYGPAYADIDLPIIQGLRGTPGEDGLAVDRQRAELAARVLSSLSARDIAERLSEVDVRDPRDASVILKGDSAIIKLGHEDFLERLRSYLELSSALHERVPDIDYVDLRFDQRVYVRPVETRTSGRRPEPRPRVR